LADMLLNLILASKRAKLSAQTTKNEAIDRYGAGQYSRYMLWT